MTSLDQLASLVSLENEVAIPTESKSPLAQTLDTAQAIAADFEQFQPREETIPVAEPVYQVSENHFAKLEHEEETEPYDAEKEARALVHTMHAIDQFVLNIAVLVKCRMSAGGSKGLEKMKAALTKEVIGEELTDHDKRLISRFKEYKSNMELLSGEMIIKPDELNRLIEVATDYCEDSKMKVGTGTAFWTNYFGSLAGRVTKIIMK